MSLGGLAASNLTFGEWRFRRPTLHWPIVFQHLLFSLIPLLVCSTPFCCFLTTQRRFLQPLPIHFVLTTRPLLFNPLPPPLVFRIAPRKLHSDPRLRIFGTPPALKLIPCIFSRTPPWARRRVAAVGHSGADEVGQRCSSSRRLEICAPTWTSRRPNSYCV